MKQKIISILFGGLIFASASHAQVSWSWSFAPNALSVSDPTTKSLSIDISVKNDAESTSSLHIGGFSFLEFPNLGVFVDSMGRPVLTLSQLSPPIGSLAPGEQVVFTSFIGVVSSPTALQDAISNGDRYSLDPNFYVSFDVPGGATYYSARASSSLQVSFAPVPEPSTALLSLVGLAALVFVCRRLHHTHGTCIHIPSATSCLRALA